MIHPTPQAQVTEKFRKLILDCVPSNWVDNLLTGKDAPELPWNCPQIEQLLNGVRKRLESALSAPPARQVEELRALMDDYDTVRQERDGLAEALEPFAECAQYIPDGWEDEHSLGEWALCLDVSDLRRAAQAIARVRGK